MQSAERKVKIEPDDDDHNSGSSIQTAIKGCTLLACPPTHLRRLRATLLIVSAGLQPPLCPSYLNRGKQGSRVGTGGEGAAGRDAGQRARQGSEEANPQEAKRQQPASRATCSQPTE